MRVGLRELVARSVGRFTGGLATPALVIGRAAPEREWSVTHAERISPSREEGGFIYLRMIQADGEAAWVSPVFLD